MVVDRRAERDLYRAERRARRRRARKRRPGGVVCREQLRRATEHHLAIGRAASVHGCLGGRGLRSWVWGERGPESRDPLRDAIGSNFD